MQRTSTGFSTAGTTFENRFMALLLKTKQENGFCQQYYLQAPIVLDLLPTLQNRLLVTFKSLQDQGETYKEKSITYNEPLIVDTSAIEVTEIQQPDPERRITLVTHKPNETGSTLILVLQSGQVCTLCIEGRQVEAFLAGIQYTLKTVGDQVLIQHLSSNPGFLMCYAVDLTTQPNIDYQQYSQEEWKLNLLSHYLGALYCCETDEGKKIVSGAVVKTSAPHLPELENNVVIQLIKKSPKLKAMRAELAPCQIFSTTILLQPGGMLSLEECLRPLHAFYLEKKAEFSI